MTDHPSSPPEDPVRTAIYRYRQRFTDEDFALATDATARAYFKMLERSLVQADIAMQDEGLDHKARLRIITAALYGSVDDGAALRRQQDMKERLVELEQRPPVIPWSGPVPWAGRGDSEMTSPDVEP